MIKFVKKTRQNYFTRFTYSFNTLIMDVKCNFYTNNQYILYVYLTMFRDIDNAYRFLDKKSKTPIKETGVCVGTSTILVNYYFNK